MMKTSRWLCFDSFGSWCAETVAAYYPGRMTEHLKSKSTGGFQQYGSPCNLIALAQKEGAWISQGKTINNIVAECKENHIHMLPWSDLKHKYMCTCRRGEKFAYTVFHSDGNSGSCVETLPRLVIDSLDRSRKKFLQLQFMSFWSKYQTNWETGFSNKSNIRSS